MRGRFQPGRVMRRVLFAGLTLGALLSCRVAFAQDAATADHAAAIKEKFQKDQVALKSYEWIETTVMTLKGEEKSRTENRVYYGADGKQQKVAVGETPEEKGKRGLRGKAVANKKAEISDYMKKAAAAIKTYIPPDPAKLQAAKAAGRTSVDVLEADKRVRVNYKDYNIPGDVLGIELDLVKNQILGVNVTTTVEGGKAPVTFQAKFATLDDGTGYPAQTVLDAKEMSVAVNVTNSGYKKQATP